MDLDMRKQRIFAALTDLFVVDIDDLALKADVSRQYAARELKRMGWVKQVFPGEYKRPSIILQRAA